MAIDVGYDESGNDDILIVSAQAGITEQAKGMSRLWKERLGTLKYFHSKEFNNFTYGIFSEAGLNRAGRYTLLRDLCKLVRRHLLFSVTASVSCNLYNEVSTPEFRSRLGTAYAFLVDMCLLMVHARLETDYSYKSDLNILIERGHRNADQVAQIVAKLSTYPVEVLPLPIRLLTTGLGEKKEHPILQVADMAAYSHWQRHKQADPTIWEALYKPGNYYRSFFVECDKEIIETFVAGPDGQKHILEKQKELKAENNDKLPTKEEETILDVKG